MTEYAQPSASVLSAPAAGGPAVGQTHCIDDGSILRGCAQLPPAWSPLRLFPPPPVDVRYSGHDRRSCLVVGGACMCCQGPQPTDMWEGECRRQIY